MNPLTLVKRIQSINSKEASLGISEEASWHAKYKDSAYVFAGGIPYELTEGDLLAIFSQYGEIVDVNLVRDKGTGKSKGFAFIAYEDQRSTILAVDNLNGAQIVGRTIRVDHVSNYKKKEEEDEEVEKQKREARGVCRAFQRGECTRGASCKFSHDEHRAANTGWGPQDRSSKWGHDKFEGPNKEEKRSDNERRKDTHARQSDKREEKRSRRHDEPKSGEDYNRREERRLRRREDDEFVPKSGEDHCKSDDKELRKHENDKSQPKSRGDDYKEEMRYIKHGGDDFERRSRDDDRREEKRSRKHGSESYVRGEQHKGGGDKWSSYGRDSSSHRYRERDDHRHKSDR